MAHQANPRPTIAYDWLAALGRNKRGMMPGKPHFPRISDQLRPANNPIIHLLLGL
jgi:hypothetical protein